MEMNIMDGIGCSLGIGYVLGDFLRDVFQRKIGRRAIIGFSGVGVRVTKGGYQILLGDCTVIL